MINMSEKLLNTFHSLNEMANIKSNRLKFKIDTPLHFYKQSDVISIKHGPRVKVFEHTSDDGFSIQIGEELSAVKKASGHGNGHLSTGDINKLINDIRLNRFAILEFFYNSAYREPDFIRHVRSKDYTEQLKRYIKYVAGLEAQGELKRVNYTAKDLEAFLN